MTGQTTAAPIVQDEKKPDTTVVLTEQAAPIVPDIPDVVVPVAITGSKTDVYLKGRILKDQVGFHKLVYGEGVLQVNHLIESLVNRGKENQFSKNN